MKKLFLLFLISTSFIISLSTTAQNVSDSLEIWKENALKGDKNSLRSLADYYYTEEQYSEAISYYKKLKNTDAHAQMRLGFCYSNGLGVEVDNQLAIYYTTQAANNGDRYAQYNMAMNYINGLNGVTPDMFKAVIWLEKSAHNDFHSAQKDLALCYTDLVEDTNTDYNKALYWFTRAALNDNADAQMLLGAICNEILQDDAETIYWLKKAIANGNEDAQEYLNNYKVNRSGAVWKEWKSKSKSSGGPTINYRSAW